MDTNNRRLLIGIGIALIIIVLFLVVACLFVYFFLYPAYRQTSTPSAEDALGTQVAQTVVAELTQTAIYGTVIPTQVPVIPTLPLPTGMPPGTSIPATSLPPTPLPTPTSLPPTAVPPTLAPTPTPIPCLWAKYVKDVSVKDGTSFLPGVTFVKTWRLMNIGSCAWTKDYQLVFVSGDRMEGASPSVIGQTVNPGQQIDISVSLRAPNQPGAYRGEWMLSTPNGQKFGIGANASGPFWVDIKIPKPEKYIYDLAYSYCTATWSSDDGVLPCPGTEGDKRGFVLLVNKPVIEKNRQENEPALWTNPQHTNDGYIKAVYPAIKISSGYKFYALVGCLSGAEKCDVTFQVYYRIGSSNPNLLYEVREVYDGNYSKIEIDLSPFAGQNVQIILQVNTNGSPDGDKAFWLSPRIDK